MLLQRANNENRVLVLHERFDLGGESTMSFVILLLLATD